MNMKFYCSCDKFCLCLENEKNSRNLALVENFVIHSICHCVTKQNGTDSNTYSGKNSVCIR